MTDVYFRILSFNLKPSAKLKTRLELIPAETGQEAGHILGWSPI